MNLENLTLGEISQIEKLSGLSINLIQDDASPKGAALAAIAYTFKRRTDPAFSWNDAQAFTVTEANELLGLNADEDEDPKAETPKQKRPSKTA